jgi:hypothetical protein
MITIQVIPFYPHIDGASSVSGFTTIAGSWSLECSVGVWKSGNSGGCGENDDDDDE